MQAEPALHELDDHQLAEALMRTAREALSSDDPVLARAESLAKIRGAAAVASGSRLALLEVAEAFVRAACPARMGKAELELRRYAARRPEAMELVRRLAQGELVGANDLGDGGEALIAVGVLQASSSRGYKLRASLNGAATEIVEPIAFHSWSRVEQAKATIHTSGMDRTHAAAYLAGEFGTSIAQAAAFLPRLTAPLATQTRAARPVAAEVQPTTEHAQPTELVTAKADRNVDRWGALMQYAKQTGNRYSGQLPEQPSVQKEAE